MSSHQRKRRGGAADSGPSWKRSRLQPSSTEVIDLTIEEVIDLTGEDIIDLTGEDTIDLTGEEVLDLTAESSQPEVITISDDESVVDSEQSQQQPHLSSTSENSAQPLAREDEEPRDTEDDWLLYDCDLPYWSDEDSEDRLQNQQQPHVSRAAENSADLRARNGEEEPSDVDGAWPAGPASPATREDEDAEDSDSVDWGPPHFFRRAENPAEVPARDAEDERRDNQGRWPDSVSVARFWMHYYPEWRYLRRQPRAASPEDNSAVPVMGNNGEEQGDDNNAQPAGPASPPATEDEDSELPEVHEEVSSNDTVNSQEQVDGSGSGRGATEAPVAESAPAEQGAEEEDTQSSDAVPFTAQQGVIISCPICMQFYSEIMQRGRQLMSTMCGHVFCSRCLPLVIDAAHRCPACREDLSPEMYHPIYL